MPEEDDEDEELLPEPLEPLRDDPVKEAFFFGKLKGNGKLKSFEAIGEQVRQ